MVSRTADTMSFRASFCIDFLNNLFAGLYFGFPAMLLFPFCFCRYLPVQVLCVLFTLLRLISGR